MYAIKYTIRLDKCPIGKVFDIRQYLLKGFIKLGNARKFKII